MKRAAERKVERKCLECDVHAIVVPVEEVEVANVVQEANSYA